MVHRPSARARASQWFVLALVIAAFWYLSSMAGANLARRNTNFGFGFLADTANFDIPFRLIRWAVGDTYARALLVCVLNTLLVSLLSIVAATLLGLLVGIMRLSTNWLVSRIALAFIEFVRNTPQLVQIIFWYVAVLQTLPPPRQSIHLPLGVLLNIRGLYIPRLIQSPAAGILWPLAGVLLLLVPFVWRSAPWGRPVGARSLSIAVGCSSRCLRRASAVPRRLHCTVSTSAAACSFRRNLRRCGRGCRFTPRRSSRRSCAPPSFPLTRASVRRR